MIKSEKINFRASATAPNPYEVTYWIDLRTDSAGGCIRYYDGKTWEILNAGQDAPVVDLTPIENDISSLKTSKVNTADYNKFKTESVNAHNTLNDGKANKATTLSGYGITDAYTKTQADAKITEIASAKYADLVDSAPETLNTLNELAAALNDDPNFATTVANQIGTKANATDVYTKAACNSTIDSKISSAIASKVTSTDVKNIQVVTEAPAIQETGVLYIVTGA